MKLYHVVAMARNRVIGRDNQLPWHFRADLKHFKQLTTGNTVLMGRKTFESIGKPLANRTNFVLSRTRHAFTEGVYFFSDLEEAFKNVATEKCFIAGGARLYKQTLRLVHGVYLTWIDEAFEGDTYYPELDDSFVERFRQRLQEEPQIDAIFYEHLGQTQVVNPANL